MISQSDDPDLPMTFISPPRPRFIAFHVGVLEVGRLWLENPLRFEGNAEQSARVMFDHVIKLHSEELNKAKELLRAAKCPDEHCDGNGTCATGRTVPGYDGEGDVEWDVWQCQWCDERAGFLGCFDGGERG